MRHRFGPRRSSGECHCDPELLACVLYWGIDRCIPVDRVESVVAGLPAWLRKEHCERGSEDPMVQTLILDHLRARGAA